MRERTVPSIQGESYLYDSWHVFEIIGPQVRALLASYESLQERFAHSPIYLCVLLSRFVRYLYEVGQYTEARRLSVAAINILDNAVKRAIKKAGKDKPTKELDFRTHPEQSINTLLANFHAILGLVFHDLGINRFGINKYATVYNICNRYKNKTLVESTYQAQHRWGMAHAARQEYNRAIQRFDIGNATTSAHITAHNLLDFSICHRLDERLHEASQFNDKARERFCSHEFDDITYSHILVSM